MTDGIYGPRYRLYKPLPGWAQAVQGISESVSEELQQRREEMLRRRDEEMRRVVDNYAMILEGASKNPLLYTAEDIGRAADKARIMGVELPQINPELYRQMQEQVKTEQAQTQEERELRNKALRLQVKKGRMELAGELPEQQPQPAEPPSPKEIEQTRYWQLRNQELEKRLAEEKNIKPGDVATIINQINTRRTQLFSELGLWNPQIGVWTKGQPTQEQLDEVNLIAENDVLSQYGRFGIGASDPAAELDALWQEKFGAGK